MEVYPVYPRNCDHFCRGNVEMVAEALPLNVAWHWCSLQALVEPLPTTPKRRRQQSCLRMTSEAMRMSSCQGDVLIWWCDGLVGSCLIGVRHPFQIKSPSHGIKTAIPNLWGSLQTENKKRANTSALKCRYHKHQQPIILMSEANSAALSHQLVLCDGPGFSVSAGLASTVVATVSLLSVRACCKNSDKDRVRFHLWLRTAVSLLRACCKDLTRTESGFISGSVPSAFFPNRSLTSVSASLLQRSAKNRVGFHLWLSSKWCFFPDSSLTSVSASLLQNPDKNILIFHLCLSSKGNFFPDTCCTVGHGRIFHDVPTTRHNSHHDLANGLRCSALPVLVSLRSLAHPFALTVLLPRKSMSWWVRIPNISSRLGQARNFLIHVSTISYTTLLLPVRHWPVRTATKVEPALSGVPCSMAKVWKSCR